MVQFPTEDRQASGATVQNLVDLAPGDMCTAEGSLKGKTRCVVGNLAECGSA